MKIEVPDLIGENGLIRSEYTCDGDDTSPEIVWNEAPKDAKSYALYCHDPDAPVGDWVHWVVINIPREVVRIPKGGPIPIGAVEVINDFGKRSYGGPCPPSGTHRYYFKLYALSVERLEDVTKENFLEKITPLTIVKAEVIGKYKRN